MLTDAQTVALNEITGRLNRETTDADRSAFEQYVAHANDHGETGLIRLLFDRDTSLTRLREYVDEQRDRANTAEMRLAAFKETAER